MTGIAMPYVAVIDRAAVRLRVAALAPAAVYLAGQGLALLMLMLTAHEHKRGLYGLLVATWDGKSFLAIADQGYDRVPLPGHDRSVAFFPGYPLTLRWLHSVTHLSVGTLSVLVSVAAGVVFAYGLTKLVDGIGLTLVALVSVSPMSVVLMMAYSEALFCAFAVWALVAMRRQSWLAAGVLVALAGTVRQTGLALILALAVAVILARPSVRQAWRPLLALVIAPLGVLGWWAWADRHTGVSHAWFQAQRGWGSRFDFGHQTVTWLYRSVVGTPSIVAIASALAFTFALVMLARLCLERRPELVAYAAAVVALDLMSAGVSASKIRLLIPAFPLLIPLARWLRDQAPRTAWAAFAGLAFAGIWYSSYMLTMYGYAY